MIVAALDAADLGRVGVAFCVTGVILCLFYMRNVYASKRWLLSSVKGLEKRLDGAEETRRKLESEHQKTLEAWANEQEAWGLKEDELTESVKREAVKAYEAEKALGRLQQDLDAAERDKRDLEAQNALVVCDVESIRNIISLIEEPLGQVSFQAGRCVKICEAHIPSDGEECDPQETEG